LTEKVKRRFKILTQDDFLIALSEHRVHAIFIFLNMTIYPAEIVNMVNMKCFNNKMTSQYTIF
jgi:hypothetical protein